MKICKLKGVYKNYIWGGETLKTYGKIDTFPIAESWEFAVHKDGESLIDSSEFKGESLLKVCKNIDLGTLNTNFMKDGKFYFPFLIKLISAAKDLSIQVHPSDDYALKYENSLGKTEIWHILAHEKGSKLYVGLNKDYSKEEIKKALENKKIISLLNAYEVEDGDTFIIESGTIHAIGAGITLIEIQQNSNITYRLYDYDRLGLDGKPRELHINKALDVINTSKYLNNKNSDSTLYECKYFKSYKSSSNEIILDESSFAIINILEGSGTIDDLEINKGDTLFIPANTKTKIYGKIKYILTKMGA